MTALQGSHEKHDVRPEDWDKVFAPSSHLAVITTVDNDGRVNAASFGTCTRVSHDPVFVAFTITVGRDTYNNVLANEEFVVNLPAFDAEQLKIAVTAGHNFDPGIDELSVAGATTIPSTVVQPPRIAEFGRHFECRVEWTHQWLHRLMVVGRVVAVSTDPGLIDDEGFLNWELAKPVHYCGSLYGEKFVAAYEVMQVPAFKP